MVSNMWVQSASSMWIDTWLSVHLHLNLLWGNIHEQFYRDAIASLEHYEQMLNLPFLFRLKHILSTTGQFSTFECHFRRQWHICFKNRAFQILIIFKSAVHKHYSQFNRNRPDFSIKMKHLQTVSMKTALWCCLARICFVCCKQSSLIFL